MKQPTWLLKNTLTKKELAVVQQLRKIDPQMRDDFERMLVNFIDEEERMLACIEAYESDCDGRSYMAECAYDRDYIHDLHLQSVA